MKSPYIYSIFLYCYALLDEALSKKKYLPMEISENYRETNGPSDLKSRCFLISRLIIKKVATENYCLSSEI